MLDAATGGASAAPAPLQPEHALAALGLRVFPLVAGTKLPAIKGWPQRASADEQSIRDLFTCPVTGWRNDYDVGIATGEQPDGRHLVVVDLDNKNGLTGSDHWELFADLNGGCAPTLTAQTASGGEHLFFYADRPVANGVATLAEGIDVRGERGFARWHNLPLKHDALIARAPDWLLSSLTAARERRTPPRAPITGAAVLDTEWAIERATEYLKNTAPEATEGAGGNAATYQVAARIKDFGVSADIAVELMLDHWNEHKAFPPWMPDELAAVVGNAYRYGTSAPGAASPDADFEPVAQPEGIGEVETGDRPLSAAELADGVFPRAEHLWHDFILKGHPNSLDGDGGIGKTQLLIQVAVAVAAGKPLFGHATIQEPVLLVLCEDTPGETKWRLTRTCEGFGVQLRDLPLHVWCRPGEDSTLAVVEDNGKWKPGPFFKPLAARLKAIGPCLLGLDTVSDVAVLDENKRLSVNTFAKQVLGGFCRDYGATVLVTRHPSKASMTDGTFYAGSTAGNAAYRNRLAMSADARGNRRAVEVVKSNYGLKGKADLLYMNDVLNAWDTVDEGRKRAEEREAVLSVLSKLRADKVAVVAVQGNGHKPKDLVPIVRAEHGMDVDAKAVLAHLRSLETERRIHYLAPRGGKNPRPATYEIGPPDGDEA